MSGGNKYSIIDIPLGIEFSNINGASPNLVLRYAHLKIAYILFNYLSSVWCIKAKNESPLYKTIWER